MEQNTAVSYPIQREASKSNGRERIELTGLRKARQVFETAKRRLLRVNEWHYFCPGLSAIFRLTDKFGKLLEGEARPGNYIFISMPGSVSKSGAGSPWIYIVHIEDRSAPNDTTESITMQVRPSPRRGNPGSSVIAHLFSCNGTSNFVIERNGFIVKAAVCGNHKKPDVHTINLFDNIRNAITDNRAVKGFSKIQWKELVNGFID